MTNTVLNRLIKDYFQKIKKDINKELEDIETLINSMEGIQSLEEETKTHLMIRDLLYLLFKLDIIKRDVYSKIEEFEKIPK